MSCARFTFFLDLIDWTLAIDSPDRAKLCRSCANCPETWRFVRCAFGKVDHREERSAVTRKKIFMPNGGGWSNAIVSNPLFGRAALKNPNGSRGKEACKRATHELSTYVTRRYSDLTALRWTRLFSLVIIVITVPTAYRGNRSPRSHASSLRRVSSAGSFRSCPRFSSVLLPFPIWDISYLISSATTPAWKPAPFGQYGSDTKRVTVITAAYATFAISDTRLAWMNRP